MKKFLPVISSLGLALIIMPACLYLAEFLAKSQMETLMLIGTGIWFASAPLWMGKDETESSS